ncbi:MAG: HesB/IscA family protein [Alphaproteobacteria bacterium]
MAQQVITLTESAANRVRELMGRAESNVIGLRVGVKPRGCSGMSYVIEYAEDSRPYEEVIEDKGVRVLIDPAATMFLIGSEMDYQESKFQSGFTFNNPNEKGRCGCGESFHV